MNVLVIGGAGYIGSHMVRLLNQQGMNPIVFDNLIDGHQAAVSGTKFIQGDILDQQLLQKVLKDESVNAVIHYAAFAKVGESVVDPAKYYQNNVVGTISLLEAMRATNVKQIVFSSTCATYGEPDIVPISESESQKPVNPYGFTKLVIERALDDYAAAYGFGFAALRYFNASGASSDGDIGEDHDPETHLIPIVLQVALGQREHITIFGNDYATPDGTCIRDYIHVDDLATAHLAALQKLESEKGLKLNLGTGCGNSVREVIEACREVTGKEIKEVIGDRRPGDPPELVANPALANETLNWQPRYVDIKETVQTAWNWHKSHPHGFED